MGRRGGRLGVSRSCACSNALTFLAELLSASSPCRLCETHTPALRPGWLSRAWRVNPVTSTSLGLWTGCVELGWFLPARCPNISRKFQGSFAKKRKQCNQIPPEVNVLMNYRGGEGSWASLKESQPCDCFKQPELMLVERTCLWCVKSKQRAKIVLT